MGDDWNNLVLQMEHIASLKQQEFWLVVRHGEK